MADDPVLVLRGFGVAFGGTPVLGSIDLEVPRRGMVVLVGPSGSGKSTLLRTLAGLNEAHPSMSTWGIAELDGRPLTGGPDERLGVGLVLQHTRFFTNTVRENLVSALPNRSTLERAVQTQIARALLCNSGLAQLGDQLDREVVALPPVTQRLLAIVRATADAPALLLADEPTVGLDDDASLDVIALLRVQSAHRAVMLVTHNQQHAIAAGGTTAFLAGGHVVERGATRVFFEEPKTGPGRRFVATGGCALPSPGATDEELDEESPRPPPLSLDARRAVAHPPVGPRGFFWVEPRRLGGLPRPGIVAEVEADLDGLEALHVTILVTLEETMTVAPAELARRGITSLHFPIPDMGAPGVAPTAELCADLEARIAAGAVVAFHCRAGMGRTGTLLASQLIWAGDTAVRAIDRVRRINPRCIQSDEQVVFLRAFENAVRPRHPSTLPPSENVLSNTTRRPPNVA
jgi:atypical dual specificity phosphatase